MDKSCGCVVFNNHKVLVIKQLNGDYGFPKGHIDLGETEFDCALRETYEETGIKANILCDERFCISYYVHDNVLKEAVYFISSGSGNITIQEDELEDCFWVDSDKVYEILSHDNLKKKWLDIYNKYKEVYNG